MYEKALKYAARSLETDEKAGKHEFRLLTPLRAAFTQKPSSERVAQPVEQLTFNQ